MIHELFLPHIIIRLRNRFGLFQIHLLYKRIGQQFFYVAEMRIGRLFAVDAHLFEEAKNGNCKSSKGQGLNI